MIKAVNRWHVCVCLYSSTVKASSVCKMSKTYLRVRINDLVLWILVDCVMPSSIIAVFENVIFHLQRRKRCWHFVTTNLYLTHSQLRFTCSKSVIETNRCEICSKFSMKTPEQRQWQVNISWVPGEYGKLSSISSCFFHALGYSYICWKQNSILQWLLLHLCLFFFSFFIFSFFCKIIIFQILIAIEFVVKGFTASYRSLVL